MNVYGSAAFTQHSLACIYVCVRARTSAFVGTSAHASSLVSLFRLFYFRLPGLCLHSVVNRLRRHRCESPQVTCTYVISQPVAVAYNLSRRGVELKFALFPRRKTLIYFWPAECCNFFILGWGENSSSGILIGLIDLISRLHRLIPNVLKIIEIQRKASSPISSM